MTLEIRAVPTLMSCAVIWSRERHTDLTLPLCAVQLALQQQAYGAGGQCVCKIGQAQNSVSLIMLTGIAPVPFCLPLQVGGAS
jgi:hypothetical protein